jgi:hypothetical protein
MTALKESDFKMDIFQFRDVITDKITATGLSGSFSTIVFGFINPTTFSQTVGTIGAIAGLALTFISIYLQMQVRIKNSLDIQEKQLDIKLKEKQLAHGV